MLRSVGVSSDEDDPEKHKPDGNGGTTEGGKSLSGEQKDMPLLRPTWGERIKRLFW